MLSQEKGSQGSVKTIGIIGGIGPESTIEYYRSIVASYGERMPDGSYPSIIINSIDLKKVLDLVSANELAELTRYLVNEIQRLARAGAECGLVAANTPHIVFDEVRRRSPIQLISIVEATCEAAKTLGLNRLKESHGIQALILGGTELSLILREPTVRDIPVLDTAKIHAKAIVAESFLPYCRRLEVQIAAPPFVAWYQARNCRNAVPRWLYCAFSSGANSAKDF
jgi:aspartate/glutamate racemase